MNVDDHREPLNDAQSRGLAVLVDEAGVRDRLAWLEQLEARRRGGAAAGWRRLERRVADLLDVLQVGVVADDDQRRRDEVARLQRLELLRVRTL